MYAHVCVCVCVLTYVCVCGWCVVVVSILYTYPNRECFALEMQCQPQQSADGIPNDTGARRELC